MAVTRVGSLQSTYYLSYLEGGQQMRAYARCEYHMATPMATPNRPEFASAKTNSRGASLS